MLIVTTLLLPGAVGLLLPPLHAAMTIAAATANR
jgi:hypothetical protein